MNKEELLIWAEQFDEYHIPRWEELPEIDYYMDQVIEFISRYVSIFSNEQLITSSMINNYVKLGLIDRPVKKKYTKNHLSMLIVITIIKQATLISDIKQAITMQMQTDGGSLAYNIFCDELEKALKNMKEIVKTGNNYIDEKVEFDKIAVKMISISLASKLLATKVVELSKGESVYNDCNFS